jgi:hypothetical protein
MTAPTGIVYLIQPEELLLTNRYKIGCSGKNNLSRLSGYKKNSRCLCVVECIYPYALENKIKEEFNKKHKLIAGKEFFEGVENELFNDFIYIVQEYNNERILQNIMDEDIEKLEIIKNNREQLIPLVVLEFYKILDRHISIPSNKNIKFIDKNIFQIYIGNNKWDQISFYELKYHLLYKVIKSFKYGLKLYPNSEHSSMYKFIVDDFDQNILEYLCCYDDELIDLIKKHCL